VRVCTKARARIRASVGTRTRKGRYRVLARAAAKRRSGCRVDVTVDGLPAAARLRGRTPLMRITHRASPRRRWEVVVRAVPAARAARRSAAQQRP
jgi:hypothetical protein